MRKLAVLAFAIAALTSPLAAQQDPNPHVPEPLLFDLVRGLGATQGELEVNALYRHDFRAGRDRLLWNPEVEIVVRDGVALELEFAMNREAVESVKLMTQITFGTPVPGRYIHGTQIIGEQSGIDGGYDIAALYVAALRFSPTWSLSFLQGAKYGPGSENPNAGYLAWLGNATVFAETQLATFGLEANVESPRTDNPTIRLTPQIHWQRRQFAVQGGVGVAVSSGTERTFAAIRVVWTLNEGHAR